MGTTGKHVWLPACMHAPGLLACWLAGLLACWLPGAACSHVLQLLQPYRNLAPALGVRQAEPSCPCCRPPGLQLPQRPHLHCFCLLRVDSSLLHLGPLHAVSAGCACSGLELPRSVDAPQHARHVLLSAIAASPCCHVLPAGCRASRRAASRRGPCESGCCTTRAARRGSSGPWRCWRMPGGACCRGSVVCPAPVQPAGSSCACTQPAATPAA